MTKPRKRAQPVQVNATVKEALPRHIDWFDRASKLTVLAVAIGSLGTFWVFGQGIFASGPLPVPSRAEVLAVDKKVEVFVENQQVVNQTLTSQLSEQHTATQVLIAQSKQELAASRTRQLRNLQLSLEAAKATLSKDQSTSNQTVVDTLSAQMEGLQAEIMKEAAK